MSVQVGPNYPAHAQTQEQSNGIQYSQVLSPVVVYFINELLTVPNISFTHFKHLLVEAVCLITLVLQIDSCICSTPLSTATNTYRPGQFSILLQHLDVITTKLRRLFNRIFSASNVVSSPSLLFGSYFLSHVCQSLVSFHLFSCIVYAVDFNTQLIKGFLCTLYVTTMQSTLACLLDL